MPRSPAQRWVAGVAKAGAACLAAMAFCSSAGAAPSNGPVVIVGNAAMQIAKTAEVNAVRGATYAAGKTLRSKLSMYARLPDARIALVVSDLAGDSDDPALHVGSQAQYDSSKGICMITLVVDPRGLSSVNAAFGPVLGLAPERKLAERIGTFELLHELGHCSARAQGMPFNHPALNAAENKSMGAALLGTPLGNIWDESYADAYALLRSFEGAPKASPAFRRAASDAEMWESFRKMARDNYVVPTAQGPKIQYIADYAGQDPHITEKAIEELRSRPERWLDDSIPIETRAAQLASIGAMRSHKLADDPERLAHLSLTLSGRTEIAMAAIAKAMLDEALPALVAGMGEKDFVDKMQGVDKEDAAIKLPLPYAMASTQIAPLARLAHAQAASLLKLFGSHGDPSSGSERPLDTVPWASPLASTLMDRAPRELMGEAIEQGLLLAALARAPAGHADLDLAAAKAWAKAERAESSSPSSVTDAKEQSRRSAERLSNMGEATYDNAVYAEPNALKWAEWRTKQSRDAKRSAPAKPGKP